jgi:integrase|tara:strand:- start:246 stop:1280 length:1035 start_codon:yes stop_codon:yes gene_type:complete
MATKYKRGNSWILNWRDANGKRHQKSIGDVSEDIAEAKLRKKKNEKLFGYETSLKESITFKEYAIEYLAWAEQSYPDSFPTKQGSINRDLLPELGHFRLDKITIKHIAAFKLKRANEFNNKPGSINRKLDDLRGLFTRAKIDNYLISEDLLIEDVPDTESKPPKLYSRQNIDAILDEDFKTPHWWIFLLSTGLRVSEFYNLKNENIHADSIHILSTKKKRTKSGKWRYVPLTKTAKNCLIQFDRDSEYLVKRPYTLSAIKTRFRRVCTRAGIDSEKRGVHCLRHTFCSYLIMSGTNLVVVQKIMGHRDIKTTMDYVHLTPNYFQDEIKNFSLDIQDNPRLTILD